jgi:hypothetical protein
LGLGQPLRQAGFHRHGTHFSRQFGDSLQVLNIQSSKWNTSELGRFTINVGVHFSSIATLLYGKDPMPVHPKEFWCLLRARVGILMPDERDHWWTVSPNTKIEEMAEEVAAACSDAILPWLGQFKTISGTNWKFRKGILQHTWAEAAANLVLGDRTKATQLVEEELECLRNNPHYVGSANTTLKEQRLAQLRAWARDQGLAIADDVNTIVAEPETK